MKHVGNQIKRLVNRSSFKQKEIAEKLGVSVQHLHNIFAKESIDTKYLFQFSEILNVPVYEFFMDEDSDINKIKNGAEFLKIQEQNQTLFELNSAYKKLILSHSENFHTLISENYQLIRSIRELKDFLNDKTINPDIKHHTINWLESLRKKAFEIVNTIKRIQDEEQIFDEESLKKSMERKGNS